MSGAILRLEMASKDARLTNLEEKAASNKRYDEQKMRQGSV